MFATVNTNIQNKMLLNRVFVTSLIAMPNAKLDINIRRICWFIIELSSILLQNATKGFMATTVIGHVVTVSKLHAIKHQAFVRLDVMLDLKEISVMKV